MSAPCARVARGVSVHRTCNSSACEASRAERFGEAELLSQRILHERRSSRRSTRFLRAARHSAVLFQPTDAGGTTRASRTARGGAHRGAMEDATVASSPPRESASTGDAVASPHRSADHAGRRVEGDNVGARREMRGARDEPTPKPVKVSETATRLRVSEATVEALEEALAAKARALAEAATREAKLRTDLDAARLGLVTSSAGDVPGDDVPAAPAAADPSAHPALREWRDRARAAESARDDAERRAARLASENAALVSMLERYRGVDPNTVDDPDPTNPPASVRDEMRVAVAEGELASCRARLRAAETALDDWRAHAASLSDRLAVAEASAAAAPAAGSPSPTSRRSRGGSTRRSDSPPPPSPPPRKSLRRPSRAVVARRRTTRVWNSHGDTSSARTPRRTSSPRLRRSRSSRRRRLSRNPRRLGRRAMRTSRWRRRWRRRGECPRRRSDGWRRGRRRFVARRLWKRRRRDGWRRNPPRSPSWTFEPRWNPSSAPSPRLCETRRRTGTRDERSDAREPR